MNELIKVDFTGERPAVSARELHEFLEVKTAYKDWFPRMCEYGFTEGEDFCSFLSESTGGRPAQDAQRNEKGKQARQYFIKLEKDWNSPEKVMARALHIADEKIKLLSTQNSVLTVQNTIMQPKAAYFDELVSRNLLTSFRETAKQLEIKEKEFIRFLMDKKYIYRDKKGKLMPYAEKNNGLFEMKESINEKTQWSGTQTLITPKGRETCRLLYLKPA